MGEGKNDGAEREEGEGDVERDLAADDIGKTGVERLGKCDQECEREAGPEGLDRGTVQLRRDDLPVTREPLSSCTAPR